MLYALYFSTYLPRGVRAGFNALTPQPRLGPLSFLLPVWRSSVVAGASLVPLHRPSAYGGEGRGVPRLLGLSRRGRAQRDPVEPQLLPPSGRARRRSQHDYRSPQPQIESLHSPLGHGRLERVARRTPLPNIARWGRATPSPPSTFPTSQHPTHPALPSSRFG